MNDSSYEFPQGFLWGAATSAYQIEGSPLGDGAGPSIWHRFSHTPGNTFEGATGDVACDHYRRWSEDIEIMAELGLKAYRFSVAWGRVMPNGTGALNRQGISFYERLVDGLLARGITPFVTLYHWDLPAALDDRGGWLNPDISMWFAEYTRAVARALGDRVQMFATLNEPWVVMDGGYMNGGLAPGHRNRFEAPRVTQNLMRAHGAAVQALRAESGAQVGLVVNLEPKYAATESEPDRAATRRADAYINRQFLDPALLGSYPDELRDIYGDAWQRPEIEHLRLVKQPLDFVGINYYTRAVHRDDPSVYAVRAGRVPQRRHAHTEMGWEVYPPGLTDTLTWFKARYGGIPVYITENGAAFYDPPSADHGVVDDPLRESYIREHLKATHAAIARGVDVRGYFAWSLLDNYEWSHGYSKRFGIVHVDFTTQQRTPKRSARFYARVIGTNGTALTEA